MIQSENVVLFLVGTKTGIDEPAVTRKIPDGVFIIIISRDLTLSDDRLQVM